jgi:hypothetical protein
MPHQMVAEPSPGVQFPPHAGDCCAVSGAKSGDSPVLRSASAGVAAQPRGGQCLPTLQTFGPRILARHLQIDLSTTQSLIK